MPNKRTQRKLKSDLHKNLVNHAISAPEYGHDPVLLEQILEQLLPAPGKIFVDCTLGRGGHAAVIAQRLGPTGLLIALDADPRNLQFALSNYLTIHFHISVEQRRRSNETE